MNTAVQTDIEGGAAPVTAPEPAPVRQRRAHKPRAPKVTAAEAEGMGYARGLTEGRRLGREDKYGALAGQVILLVAAFVMGAFIF